MSDSVPAAAPAAAPVLFEELATGDGYRIGLAVLNAERSLNALSLPMIRLLARKLAQWRVDERVACVVLRGAGEKSFCAGGDMRAVRTAILAHRGHPGPVPDALAFFSEEYRLDYEIHRYPKPILVWGNGIVMGGGVGLLVGASHRVVTETSRLAMPEINIGLYPDVGGSWFLQRMPNRVGLFIALTAAPLNAADACHVGLGDWFLRGADYPVLLEQLKRLAWSKDVGSNHAALSQALLGFARDAAGAAPVSGVRTHSEAIAELTRVDSLPQLVQQITHYAGSDEWFAKAASTLAHGSPTTAGLIWELFRRTRHLGLADALRMELIVSVQCCEHPDLPEGVRAVLVDKDHKPRWTPPSFDQLTHAWIEEHFQAPWRGENPLSDLE
jgi:enoyl-CoA hydratase/carnithine racemase